ncbi:MAG TPA: hypothetical protein DCQ33_13095 [Nitrospira sp.]|nr:hypothetical protein [Nitrospira sp.]
MSYYKILGVDPNATPKELKQAYRRLAKQCHPDHHPGDKQKEARFQEISTAYRVLSDPLQRTEYDRRRAVGNSPKPHDKPWTPQPTSVRHPPSGSLLWDFITIALGIGAVALPLIAVASSGSGSSNLSWGSRSSSGRQLPRRGPDGRFRRG